MKKKVRSLFAATLLSVTLAQAQNLPNASFDNWKFDTTKVINDWNVSDMAGLSGTDSSVRLTNTNVENANGMRQGDLDPSGNPMPGYGIPFNSTDSVSLELKFKNNSANSMVLMAFMTADRMVIGGMGGIIQIPLPNVGESEFTSLSLLKFVAPVGATQCLIAPFVESPFGGPATLGLFLEIDDIKFVEFKNGNNMIPIPNGTCDKWTKKYMPQLIGWKNNNGQNGEMYVSIDTLGSNNFAAKIVSKGDNNNINFGELSLGKVWWNNNKQFVEPGEKLDSVPNKFFIKYNYNTVGNDSAEVMVVLTKRRGDTTAIVGQTYAKLGKNVNFDLVEFPIWMYQNETQADSITITIISGYANPSNTSILKVDSIAIGFPHVTGINNESNVSLSISPNPATGLVKIANGLTRTSEVTVSNLLGEVVATKSFNAATTLDLSSQAKGIYLVQVSNNGKTITSKIVLQ